MKTSIDVLVLEDSRDDAELLIIELQMNGFDVHWERVETRDDFVKHLSPDLDIILADYSLPQFDAPAALGCLQQESFDIPFIVVTGAIEEEKVVEVMRNGASDYLLKDRLSRLSEAVRHALDQRQLREEKALAERELRVMDWAIHSSINAVAMADLDGRITFVNQSFLDLWGYQSSEHVEQESLLMLWEKPNEAKRVENALERRENLQSEMFARKQNGVPMTLQFSTSTVLDEERRPICIMAMFIDITASKRAGEAQREAEILRIQLEKEKELRDLKFRFMSMVIHDFRNPLAVMQLQLDALIRYSDRLDAARKEERIMLTLNQIQHLNSLMDDVLTISKMETSDARFAPDEQDLVVFCKQVIEEFSESISSNHALRPELPAEAVFLSFDRQLMRRAVTNLLSNAVKYSPNGGTTTVTLMTNEDYATIGVTDEGMGIPEDDQKRLFDAFHRAGNVGQIEGTGLGLAIVKQVVELHGGTITFFSELNKGTTFTIKLPLP